MGTYATTAHVESRTPGRTLNATSKPTTVEVDIWIDEAEAELTATLKAAQCTTPITDPDGVEIMRKWVCWYAVGMTKKAWAGSAADGNEDGEIEITRFEALIVSISNDHAYYCALLGGSGSGHRHVRSHVLDNSDSKTIADGDFDPVFEMDEVF